MYKYGINVPPGFIITTETSIDFDEREETVVPHLEDVCRQYIQKLEIKTGKKFQVDSTGQEFPLFLSVRSGSAVNMLKYD